VVMERPASENRGGGPCGAIEIVGKFARRRVHVGNGEQEPSRV
jgi:hypothetical protein